MAAPWARWFLLLSMLGAAVVASFAFRRPGGFQVVGPGGGGAMFHPTISPHDPRTAFVACDMTGGYVTHDAGASWRMFNLRGTIAFFTFDPSRPGTVYAGATGLWRSTDNALTWTLVWPRPADITSIEMNSDHADETIVARSGDPGVFQALAVHPHDSRILVAAFGTRTSVAVLVSRDGGSSWSRETTLDEPILQLWIDPRAPAGLWVAAAHGVKARNNGTWRWLPAPNGVSFTGVSAGFGSAGPPVFYAASEQAAWISRDGAASWEAIQLPGQGAKVRAVATSAHHPETAYVSYRDLAAGGTQWFGVARTHDSGHTWQLVWKENTSAAGANVHDAWITATLGPDWGENPLNLGVADQDPALVYATDLGRTMRSTDAGATWNAVYSGRAPSAQGWTTTGLDVTTSYGYHVDPFDAKRRFITFTDIGLSRSEDAGRSWTRSMDGVPHAWSNTAYWMVFDPSVKGRVWAVMSGTHDLPRPKMWRRTPVTRYKGGVCRSEDGGRTWKVATAGMPETAPTHILLDSTSPPDRRVLYVAAFGRGVYKSTDGGAAWELRNRGIAQDLPLAWRLAAAADGTLYLVVARRSEHGEIGDNRDGALYRSRDGAANWEPVTLPPGVNGPNGLAIDPADPRRLYLAAWARASGTHGEGGGVFLSIDGGRSWTPVLDRDQHVYDVTIDPRNPETLYACGFESSAWRSLDRGAHWSRISGFNFKWGHRVIPDPDDASRVFITTFGGSVWHGAASAPQAFLDIHSPEMAPGR
jgi:photosystem II stability/assembly factor-like uncharacterized protein